MNNRAKTKLRNNLATSSRLSLTFNSQKVAHINELPTAKNTPSGSANLKLKGLPSEEMRYTPKKLTSKAMKLTSRIFCFKIMIERNTSTMGHVKLRG